MAAASAVLPASHAAAGQTFTVAPSGGDDTASIQAAFDAALAAGPGSAVELTAGQFYTNTVLVTGFDGSFFGAGEGLTVVDALRGLDPSLPGATERPTVGAVLFWFADSSATISDLTFDITPYFPAEPWQLPLDPTGSFVTVLVAPISIANHADPTLASLVQRVTVLGHAGEMDGFNTHGGIDVGNIDGTPPVFGNVTVADCTFSYLLTGVNAWGITGGALHVEGNEISDTLIAVHQNFAEGDVIRYSGNAIRDSTFGLGVGQILDSEVEISHNSTSDTWWGIYVDNAASSSVEVFRNEIHRPAWYGITVWQGPGMVESRYVISHNTIRENGSTADGIGLEDVHRLVSGAKSIDAVVSHNTIEMDTPFSGVYVLAVDGGKLLNNRISGTMGYGIVLAITSEFDPRDTVPNWVLVGNNVQNVVPTSGGLPWVPSTPIYLGPGTSNTTVAGGSNATNAMDLGSDNVLTGVNVHDGAGLGHAVSGAMQERCDQIGERWGFDPCAAP